jgi:hypothetical protein
MSELDKVYMGRLRECSRIVTRGMIIVGILAVPSFADAQTARCPERCGSVWRPTIHSRSPP